jgi:hypothetical protein
MSTVKVVLNASDARDPKGSPTCTVQLWPPHPALADFFAGCVGGVLSTFAVHPLDAVRLRAQVQLQEHGCAMTSWQCAKNMYRTGGVWSFWKGSASPMLGYGVARAAQLAVINITTEAFVSREVEKQRRLLEEERRALELARRKEQELPLFERWAKGVSRTLGIEREPNAAAAAGRGFASMMQNEAQLPIWKNAVCGGLGGVAFGIIYTPFDVVRIRMQTAALFEHRSYLNTIDCANRIWVEGGVRKLFRGLNATMIRDVPATVMLFGTMAVARSMVSQDSSNVGILWGAAAGGVAGVVSWLTVLPLDAVKTSIQASRTHRSWKGAARNIYERRGISGFYRGLAPMLLRGFVGTAALGAGMEGTNRLIQRYSAVDN